MESQASLAPATTPNWSAGFRRRTPFYILIAIFFSLLAGVLVFAYLEDVRSRMLPSVRVVVASRDLLPGTSLTAEQLELVVVPEGIVPEGALHDVGQAIGRSIALPIDQKQMILASSFADSSQAGLSARLPDDHWAFVLPVTWLASPVAATSPGDRFDMLAYQAGRPADEAGVIVSEISLVEAGGESGFLTLIVTLEEARAVLYARANGFTLVLLLRSERS